MRNASRTFVLLAAVTASGALPLLAVSTAQAASVIQTCDGKHTTALKPSLTNTAEPVTGTSTYELGDAANLLGFIGGYDCQSSDNNKTADEYTGATATVDFTATASCSNLANGKVTGGSITWDDGDISTLGVGTTPVEDIGNADGIVEYTAPIVKGPFAGETLTIQNQGSTNTPDNCATTGVAKLQGSTSIEIK